VVGSIEHGNEPWVPWNAVHVLISGVIIWFSVSLLNRFNVGRCQFECTLRLSSVIRIPKRELELWHSVYLYVHYLTLFFKKLSVIPALKIWVQYSVTLKGNHCIPSKEWTFLLIFYVLLPSVSRLDCF
jgi:hypothetical protein